MEIVIDRFGSYHHAVSGRLLIDGQHVCDTLEEDVHCLPEGEYALQRNSKLALPYYIRLEDADSGVDSMLVPVCPSPGVMAFTVGATTASS